VLAASSGVAIGPNEGIEVDLGMHAKARKPDDVALMQNVFSCGDCCEIVDPMASMIMAGRQSAVWRNWSCARETAVACARSIVHDGKPPADPSEVEWLVFSQSLKLFSYYIYASGAYLEGSVNSPNLFSISEWRTVPFTDVSDQRLIVVAKPDEVANRYVRLVLVQGKLRKDATSQNEASAEQQVVTVLVGALVMGQAAADHRLGMNLHRTIKLYRRIASLPSADDPSQWLSFGWEQFVRENRKSEPDTLVHSWIRQSCLA
jgi:hypothetical protein